MTGLTVQKLGDERRVPHLLPRRSKARRTDDRRKIVDGSRKVLIHNNIIEFAAVPHFFPGGIQAARDDFR